VINVSNIDYVYSADPRKHSDAKPLEALSWSGYRKMVGDKWDPGLSAPFDPVASRFCHEHKISVAIVNGLDLKRVADLLVGKKFKGTIIS
jgi:uridylate kinase